MRTLRLRLLVAIGASFTLFWTVSSIWTLVDLRTEFRDALDERLAASARMVAGLIADAPELASQAGAPSSRRVPYLALADNVACEIRLLRGGVVGRTRNSPERLGLVVPGFRTRTIDGVAWRSYTIEQNGVRITTADKVERRHQLFNDIAMAAFLPFLIAMAATLLALWFVVRYCLRPLERIRCALATRKPDALQPLEEDGLPGELAPLVATVNGLLTRIGHTIERERRFTGDAAHELRTPLTAVKTHLQVARKSGNGAGAALALDQAEQGVQRLQGIIDQLLTLARVEGAASYEGEELLAAGPLAQLAIDQMPPAQAARVRLGDEGGCAQPVRVPASLAVTALRNLLDNALRYGDAQAPVALRVRLDAQMVVFVVEDHGAGMNEDEIAKAGQRFWRKGRGQGSGLGLSIVNAIAARYGGRWELRRRDCGGTAACLALPAAPRPAGA
ncbi:ATP-binding protein [Massilia sp.]|uniref:ATP-binding protein n=1 Tax=Massilia sp. TaxID=1882437 RepID=UPI0028B1BB8E|nr:ATP-binding protein [Massilia sp.]